MKRLKRIMAWIAIVLLIGMYIVTAVMAFMATPGSFHMFQTSLAATIMVPVMIYVVLFLYRLIHPEKDAENSVSREQEREERTAADRMEEQEAVAGRETQSKENRRRAGYDVGEK